jgi:acyl-CoA reductase-like NAD-dependent aldehyde dehydrogenase
MKMFLAGAWTDKPHKLQVRNPYDDSVIDTVPKGESGDVDRALGFAERGAKVMAKLSGYERVNWGPQWRVDLMPYGGLKNSGFGKEGPRYAVEEMTEFKMVVFHLNS